MGQTTSKRRFNEKKKKMGQSTSKEKLDEEEKMNQVASIAHGHHQTLPSDIVEQVLLRLPLTSLLKFQLACNLFKQLSTTRHFISAHSQRCRDNPELVPTLLLSYEREKRRPALLHGAKLNRRVTNKKVNIEVEIQKSYLPLDFDPYGYKVIDVSCDGLLCTRIYGDGSTTYLSIVNPFSGQRFAVPPLSLGEGKLHSVIGFYYHEFSGQYKLLLYYLHSYCATLTLGPNTLRTLSYYCPMRSRVNTVGWNVSMNGKIYYMDSNQIVVFDTDSEKFSYLPVPFSFKGCGDSQLLEIEGKICICDIINDYGKLPKIIELWVLMDCEEWIWMKKHNVCVKMLQEQEFASYKFISCSRYHHYFLLVKSSGIDIESPYENFTFYYFEDIKKGSHNMIQVFKPCLVSRFEPFMGDITRYYL